MDRVTPEIRSKIMAAIKSKDTGPELVIRKALHRLGYRYTLHQRDLPGKPDVVFPSRWKALFVHGCFWHGHNCSKGRSPKTNRAFWRNKVRNNKSRDLRTSRALRRAGWSAMTVWQCQTGNLERLVEKIVRFLESK